jgi:uncharacterized Tic20 family protein
MTIQAAGEPTQDERLLAAVAHFFGLVIALIVWATQKDKSRFIRFQALQAVAFDLSFVLVFFVGFACMFVMIFGGTMLGALGTAALGADDSGAAGAGGLLFSLAFILPFAAQCVIFALMGIFFVARIIAAISVFQGRDFRYPVLGERVEQFLSRP